MHSICYGGKDIQVHFNFMPNIWALNFDGHNLSFIAKDGPVDL
jgi:hypothetical protein